MSKTTTNYGLIKPELTDAADITAMNSNWDKIDAELKTRIKLTDLATETWTFTLEDGSTVTKVVYVG